MGEISLGKRASWGIGRKYGNDGIVEKIWSRGYVKGRRYREKKWVKGENQKK